MTDFFQLPYGRQYIDEIDIEAVVEVLKSDFLTCGPAVGSFEAGLAKIVQAPHVTACANGTAALHMASMALDLAPGDWVIVPAVTFLATANAVRFVGADVWFADVDPETGLLTQDGLERAYQAGIAAGKEIKAVYSVHLNGQVADPVEIYNFAQQNNIYVVEDASHAIGSTFEMEGGLIQVGSCQTCDMTTFSFHPVKTITMGEGGAVTCKRDALFRKLQLLRNHGMTRSPGEFKINAQAFSEKGEPNPWYYEMHQIGFNYRASDISCALGLSQLNKLETFKSRRSKLATLYDEELEDLAPLLRPVAKVFGCHPVLHLYPVLIDFSKLKFDRASLMKALAAQGILTQVHYLPVNRQPYYTNLYGQFELPGANAYYENVLSLPFFPAMTDEQVSIVVRKLKKYLLAG